MRLSASIVTYRSNLVLFNSLADSLICALRRAHERVFRRRPTWSW